MTHKLLTLLTLGLALPHVAAAQTLQTTLYVIRVAIYPLLYVAFGAALMFFLWGLVTYIMRTDSPDGVEVAKQRMIWGVVAIFVLVSIWGILAILALTFGVDITGLTPAADPDFPQLPEE